jgi:cytidine deaminase
VSNIIWGKGVCSEQRAEENIWPQEVVDRKLLVVVFKLSPCFECRTLSSGLFSGVCG